MTDAAFYTEIDAFIRENRENILRDIRRICAVPSVNGPAEEGKPFGAGPAKALDTALTIADEMGLHTNNCEGYMGYASCGQGTEYLATICHLDVVPAGDGWLADPFTVREREGWLIGRGVMDDKGPAILTLYLLKYLKEKNVPLKHEIRALLGVNEEIGMKDVDWYLEHYDAPKFCFTPDAAFPVCNGEKGIFHGRVISRAVKGHVKDIRGGVAGNAVPAKAEAWVIASGELPNTERVTAEKEGELWHLTATGKSGHAAHPGGAVNAIALLVDYMLENHIPVPEEARYFRVLQKIHSATDGSGIGVAANDGKFDALTLGGSVNGVTEDGHFFQVLDSRYPTNTSGEKIRSTIEVASEGAAKVVTDGDAPPFFIEADRPEIRSLIETFNAVTGQEAKPFTMGGGTYARHFPNAASFGAESFQMKAPEWVGGVHGPEEGGNIDWLMTALKIYIAAMIKLDSSLE